ncbi:membrane protein insertase YidC [Clostridium septicum]|uniref:Membrane protein insertase YidC n=1 Tax=Clostridium septicum TaxID=1504 RepID=A0A9N7JLV7_CLOSE|nr:membrane protein insertase YidC [Clostridium septicum]AYE34325.1 membrane protein insertase YidC [Clostridium septicum]MDU1314282.1 membrane protein insertase YidC [Clostridium septicum]QAS59720.1 membrane protein insertase YidC [Clostridium septicum]UEC21038.1 membrane protein insertase YidC [Clostridium septicum]USS00914.1 membrane protein insertase YidC [Clostridium septicum]
MMSFLSPVADFLGKIFNGLHEFILQLFHMQPSGVSYVLAIFIFTLIIRLLILPLNVKSTRSNARLQEIQPELQKLQKKYANDPQKMQLEYSKLMKENKVSMFGGCLPTLLPLPILFALYYVFMAIKPGAGMDTSFLWIPDVFAKDPWFILPVLAFLSTYLPSVLLSKSMPQNPDSPMNMSTMNIMMSGMMAFMAINFSAILVIYWVIGGIIQLGQTYFLNYLPYKKKQAEKANKDAESAVVNAKKATPKTKKRN